MLVFAQTMTYKQSCIGQGDVNYKATMSESMHSEMLGRKH